MSSSEYLNREETNVYDFEDFEDDSVNTEDSGKNNYGRASKIINKRGTGGKKMTSLAQRVTSAKKLKINELQNKVDELKNKLKEKETENKLLRKVQARQEKELSKLESTKADIPNIFQHHSEEVRGLQNRLKQVKEKCQDVESQLKIKDTQLQKKEKELHRLQKIVTDNELIEKESLQQTAKSLKLDLQEKEETNQNLNKKLDLLIRSHRQELMLEGTKHRETTRKLNSVQENSRRLEINLTELRKMKEKQNIYAMALARTPSRVLVHSGTFEKDTSIRSEKLESREVSQYSTPTSDESNPETPVSGASPSKTASFKESVRSDDEKWKIRPNVVDHRESIDATKKESLLAKLKTMEQNTTEKSSEQDKYLINVAAKKLKENHSSVSSIMPEVSVNSETTLNPRRTSGRRRSSLSPSSNENLLFHEQKPHSERNSIVTGNDKKRKNDLMVSLFGKPSVSEKSNDSILDFEREIIQNRKTKRDHVENGTVF